MPGAVEALLAGLEHEDDVARELGAVGAQEAGGADESGGVQVVAAGVHDAVVARDVVRVGFLGDGEGVHVAAQQHHRPRAAAVQDGRDRGQALAGGDLERQPVEGGQDRGLGLRQLEPDLGDAVQLAPQGDQLVFDGRGLFPEVHARSLGSVGRPRQYCHGCSGVACPAGWPGLRAAGEHSIATATRTRTTMNALRRPTSSPRRPSSGGPMRNAV